MFAVSQPAHVDVNEILVRPTAQRDEPHREVLVHERLREFKAFVLRGNVVDLAVAIVIGTAFTAVVKALVDDC